MASHMIVRFTQDQLIEKLGIANLPEGARVDGLALECFDSIVTLRFTIPGAEPERRADQWTDEEIAAMQKINSPKAEVNRLPEMNLYDEYMADCNAYTVYEGEGAAEAYEADHPGRKLGVVNDPNDPSKPKPWDRRR